MTRVEFILLSEGSDERGLVPHLEALCVRAGADEAIGEHVDFSRWRNPPGRSVKAKLFAAKAHDMITDLVFVHRDGDKAGRRARLQEIGQAVQRARIVTPYVPVIPIRELEAWMLVSESDIRAVAGNPNGRAPLRLPSIGAIEDLTDPKACLEAALLVACKARGRKLARYKANLSARKAQLLDLLDTDGPVNQLLSWRSLVADIEQAVAKIRDNSSP